MSCSVHDAIALEDRGVPAVAIHTHTFLNSARAHARAYGRPDFVSLAVPGPIANVSAEAVRRKAEGIIDAVVAVLVGREGPEAPAAGSTLPREARLRP